MKRFIVRLIFIGGGLLGIWRLFIRFQNRPTPPNPQELITPPDEHSRILPFKSVANFRDIGGYPTIDGRHTKWGTVYRGASLAYLLEEEHALFDALNIKTLCDLRTHDEIKSAKNRLRPYLRTLNIPTSNISNRFEQLSKMIFQPHYLDAMLAEVYINALIELNPQLFSTVFKELANPEHLPLYIHCTAGKDRTGLAIALLLRVLGVSEEIVLADYTLSNHFYVYFRHISSGLIRQLGKVGLKEAHIAPLLMADKRNLKIALDHITSRYGSIEAYLEERAGIDSTIIEQLKANLLE